MAARMGGRRLLALTVSTQEQAAMIWALAGCAVDCCYCYSAFGRWRLPGC